MGPQTLPTIWGTYMKLVTKYQISATVHLLNSAFTEKQLGGSCTTAGTTTECLDSNSTCITVDGSAK
jgi:hypothetical protein